MEKPLAARDLGRRGPAPLPEPPLEAVDAVGPPDAAAGVDAEPGHRLVLPAAITEWREALTVVVLAGHDHGVAGADQQPSAPIDGQGVHLGSGARERPARPRTGVVAEQPAQMPQPHPAVDVLDQRAGRADGQAAGRAVFGEERETAAALDPVAQRAAALAEPGPELAAPGDDQRADRAIDRGPVEEDEPRAVEADQPAAGPQPQEAVGILGDRQYFVGGEAVGRAPRRQAVFVEDVAQVERGVRWSGGADRQDQRERPHGGTNPVPG